MIKALTIEIFGRVQGVGFRYYATKKAHELGISGFVRNRPDGSVYIEAEGNETPLNEFLIWCHKGPQWAKVTDVVFSELPPLNYTNFTTK